MMITEKRRGEETRAGGTTSPPALVDLWRAGDAGAFREVVDRFHGPLLSYVVSLLGHLQDAEDVVQETWMRAHRSVHQIHDASALWGWLKRIAHNTAMDAAKRSRRRGIPTDPAALPDQSDGSFARGNDRDGSDSGLSLETIVKAIEALPETYREAAVYHYLQEWPYAKIAETLGIDEAAARQRISRGAKMLRNTLRLSREAECHDM